MEIIVTEMPELPCQCTLSKQNRDGEWICSKYDAECNIDMCDLLIPIDDYVLQTFKKDYIYNDKCKTKGE